MSEPPTLMKSMVVACVRTYVRTYVPTYYAYVRDLLYVDLDLCTCAHGSKLLLTLHNLKISASFLFHRMDHQKKLERRRQRDRERRAAETPEERDLRRSLRNQRDRERRRARRAEEALPKRQEEALPMGPEELQ